MGKVIQIIKENQLESEHNLEPGSYTLGRDPSCDIVLSDQLISKKHATMTIDEKGCSIKDNNSANGVYYKGKRIAQKKFNKDFGIQIGTYTIKALEEISPGNAGTFQASSGMVRKLILSNIRTSLFLLIASIVLISFLISNTPFKKEIINIKQKVSLRTGILLTRYLAEMNRFFLETDNYNQVRLTPVSEENGVLYAFILDSHGRIIAPKQKQGNFFNWPGLAAAFKNAKLTMEDGKKNEKIIFNPINQQDRVIGAAVVGFAYKQMAKNDVPGTGGTTIILLVFLFIISLVIAYFLVKVILDPLKVLHEEVELAIKEGGTELNIPYYYKEVDNLKLIFNRLLLRKSSTGISVQEDIHQFKSKKKSSKPSPAEQIPVEPVEKVIDPVKNSEVDNLKDHWCMIDKENYTLDGFSDNLSEIFGQSKLMQGMHLIEAFETDIIQAVSQLLDNPQGDGIDITYNDKQYSIIRLEGAMDTNKVTVVFKDKV